MRGRLSRIRPAPLVAGVVLFYLVGQVGGKVLADWRSWDEINRDFAETEAAVINKMVGLSKSGKVTKYDITYEFVAPAVAGGSGYSRAALGAALEDKFFKKPAAGGGGKMPEPRSDGNQYFSRTQAVDPEVVSGQSGGNTIQVAYAKNNPRNSVIKGTGGHPLFLAALLVLLLVLGGYLIFLGLSRTLRSAGP